MFFGLVLVNCHSVLGADNKNDPAQYILTIHVSTSEYVPTVLGYQNLTVTISGKHFRLEGGTSYKGHFEGLLNPGDYHARLSKDEHRTSYESDQEFEFLFPDGSTRRFRVVSQSE